MGRQLVPSRSIVLQSTTAALFRRKSFLLSRCRSSTSSAASVVWYGRIACRSSWKLIRTIARETCSNTPASGPPIFVQISTTASFLKVVTTSSAQHWRTCGCKGLGAARAHSCAFRNGGTYSRMGTYQRSNQSTVEHFMADRLSIFETAYATYSRMESLSR